MGERESATTLPPEIAAAIDTLEDTCLGQEHGNTIEEWQTARARLEALIAGLVEKAEKADARYNRICDMASSSRRDAGTPWP